MEKVDTGGGGAFAVKSPWHGKSSFTVDPSRGIWREEELMRIFICNTFFIKTVLTHNYTFDCASNKGRRLKIIKFQF